MGAAYAVLRRPEVAHLNHPNAVVLRPPVNVSPFIRFCRWSALGAGILYGWYRYRQLCIQHVSVRDYEHKQDLAEQHMQAKIKKWMLIESTQDVLQEFGLEASEEMMKGFGVDMGDAKH